MMSFGRKSMEFSCIIPMALFLLGMLLSSPLEAANFDYYHLVLMWPSSYCAQFKCCHPTTGTPANDFLIRGLWPVNATTGKSITKCSEEPFNKYKLKGLEEDLNLYWSNLRCPSNNGMSSWKSIWEKYGTCSGLGEASYFKTTLHLRNAVKLLSTLIKKGITPFRYRYSLYSYESIEKAIEEEIGAKPMIRCNSKYQLYEVYICLDKYAKTPIKCPVDLHFTCSPLIYFPPIDPINP